MNGRQMANDAHRAILRQIVGDARVAMPSGASSEAGPDGVFSLRLEAARTLRDDFGLTAVVEACEASRPRLEDLPDEVLPDRLSLLLRGMQGRLGLLVFSPELAAALLEWRLLGMLSPEAPAPRPLTGTDAAILADLTDPLLTRFAAAMVARPGGDWAVGYHQGAPVEDARHIPLTLAAGAYHGFRLTLRLGDGTRGGWMFIALPESHAPAPVKAAAESGPPWPDALRVGVLGAELVLNAVLWRTRLPASAVGRLQPGDLLHLPLAALTSVRLEAPGRVAVAQGRLGQSNGERAVKIAGPEDGPPGLAGPAMSGHALASPGARPAPGYAAEPMPMDEPDLGGDGGFPAMGTFDAGGDFGADFDAGSGDFPMAFPAMGADLP